MQKSTLFANVVFLFASITAYAQSAPNVSQVVMSSTVTTRNIVPVGPFTPTASGSFSGALLSIYTDTVKGDFSGANNFNTPKLYAIPSTQAALSSALSANIAVALSIIPVESPTSGVILKTDEATGASLPVSSTLGPIFTKRAETIGKGKFYLGFTHQNYHFTSFNGQSLNGLSVLYGGGEASGILNGTQPTVTSQATFNLGMDVRISQDVAFLTYGVTNRFDVSLGLPVVHAAVASTAYNGIIYSGTGTDFNNGDKCWCVATFTPGSFALTAPQIGQASGSKTGFGDVILRFKDAVLERPNAVVAVGADLRLPSGDAENYLGIGTTAVKPFLAVSLYSKPLKNGIVFAPHAEIGWQYSGKSVLGGTLQGSPKAATLSDGSTVPYFSAPFTSNKDYLPDVFSWALGTEVALGRHNTVVVDILGNQIGWVHGVQTLQSQAVTGPAPAGVHAMTSGLVASPSRSSFGQYSGAFGYKTRLFGNLVATFQMLVRFDNNGLTARLTPLYGLGYSF